MIEHFDKQSGLRLLAALLQVNRNVLLTTPIHFFEQDWPGNPYERHLSHWGIEDFRAVAVRR